MHPRMHIAPYPATFNDIIVSELMLKHKYKFALWFVYYQQRIFYIFMLYYLYLRLFKSQTCWIMYVINTCAYTIFKIYLHIVRMMLLNFRCMVAPAKHCNCLYRYLETKYIYCQYVQYLIILCFTAWLFPETIYLIHFIIMNRITIYIANG